MALDARVAEAIAQQRFDSLAALLDGAELESGSESWPPVLHALHLLGHIYLRELADARYVWKRIPAAAKQGNADLEAVFRLLQFYWNRHYRGMWQALGQPWSPQLKPMIDALAAKTREDLVELIGYAYSSVSPAKVANICGMSEADALAVCQAQGWQYDAATNLVTVSPKAASKTQTDGYANLVQLSEYMVSVEQ